MTYHDEAHYGDKQVQLLKLVLGIGSEPTVLSYETCDEATTADNIPGGLESRAFINGYRVTTTLMPLLLPDTSAFIGGAVIHVRSELSGIFIRFGCGDMAWMHASPAPAMKGTQIDCEGGQAILDDTCVTVTREGRKLITCVKGTFNFRICEKEDGTSYAEGFTDATEAYLIAGFSKDAAEALALASRDPLEEVQKVQQYYEDKFRNLYIRTPSPDLDEAFRHAYLNLEYAWLYPFGWIESIQHWPTMWHMEQTAAEEWAGNAHRTRRTLLSQLEHLFDSGAVPDLCTNNIGRRDWGGNNQFFFREIWHYLQMTDDREFAELVEPYMRRILAQTFREYDSTGTGVLAWHSQIGNQEDFESTPGRGAAPGCEGARMLEIMSDFYKYLGNEERAAYYAAASAYCFGQTKKRIWNTDLGRFVWFVDDLDEPRLDVAYQGICYPIIYGQLDSFDAVSSADHLLHRLTGPEGEMYQSNHFGDHGYWGVPTWGMQAGSDMQPFATAAYAKLGYSDEAIRPLEFVARRVCGDYQRGAFPETANEKRFAYFSPSAGVFAQSVIEHIFGINRDRVSGTTTLSPSMPSDWDDAEICLPSAHMTYKKSGDRYTLTFASADRDRKRLVWRMKHLKSAAVIVNGEMVSSSIARECGFSVLTAEIGEKNDLTVEVVCAFAEVSIDGPKVIACGEKLTVRVSGGELMGTVDRLGVLDENGCIRADLLDKYARYGDFGLVNFARRTIAYRVLSEDVEYLIPWHITVVPAYRVSAVYEPQSGTVSLTFVNRTASPVASDAHLCTVTDRVAFRLDCPAFGETTVTVPLGGHFVTGRNRAVFVVGFAYRAEIDIEAPTTGRVALIPLPQDMKKEAAYWRKIALFPHHGCTILGPDSFLTGYDSTVEVGGIAFPFDGNFIPVSTREHRAVTIPLKVRARKLFVLFSAFADDHEICSHLFTAEIRCKNGESYLPPIIRRDLTFPGELEYGFGYATVVGFSTYVPGAARPSVSPSLGAEDYEDVMPPTYPQHSLWCRNKTAECGGAVLNLLEFDLGREMELDTLTLISHVTDGAGGVFGIAYEL